MKRSIKKEKFLKALVECNGNISKACMSIQLVRQDYYDWLKNDPNFVEELNQLHEGMKDLIEEKVLEKINSGSDLWMDKWLVAKAADRGWGKAKTEHEGNINVVIKKEIIDDAIKTEVNHILV